MNESSAEVGRAAETERVDALLDHLRQGGAALVIRGDPGIGKSALLQHAGERAGDLGAAVLTTIGTESEAELAFAGLYALLRPVINRMGSPPGRPRRWRRSSACCGPTARGAWGRPTGCRPRRSRRCSPPPTRGPESRPTCAGTWPGSRSPGREGVAMLDFRAR